MVRPVEIDQNLMNWYYANGGNRSGPIAESELIRLVSSGVVQDETLVWKEGMAGWEPFAKLRSSLASSPAAPPSEFMAPTESSGGIDGKTGGSGLGSGGEAAGTVLCAECGKTFPESETVLFGTRHVCAGCKPVFLQRLREGAPMPASGGNWISEEQLLQQVHGVEIGESVTQAARLLTQPVGLAMGAGVLISFLNYVVQIFPYIGGLLSLIFTGPFTGGLMALYLRKFRGESPELGVAFSGFGPRFGALASGYALPALLTGLSAGLVALVAIIPAMFLGIAPGANQGVGWVVVVLAGLTVLVAIGLALFLSNRWQYTLLLVADKGYRVTDAMRLSWALVGQNPWPHLGFLLVRYLLIFAGVLALCVGILVTTPIATAALVSQYDRVFRSLQPKA